MSATRSLAKNWSEPSEAYRTLLEMAGLQSSERIILNCLILLVSCRVNDIERHCEEKMQNNTASEASTTASVVARPTPTAPSRAVNPFWQLMKTMSMPKQNAFDR